MKGLIIDSFAGGGGASTGIEWALGRSPDFAINHDDDALLMHAANHPQTVHLKENIWKVDPVAVTKGRPIFCLWASPDCRHHSKAKGGAPVSRSVRGLADVILVWAETVSPQIIMLENVEEFAQWGPLGEDGKPCPYHKGAEFARWVRHLERLGYAVEWRELRACDYGAPTIRKRLFLVARRDRKPILWPAPTHARRSDPRVVAGMLKPYRTAAEIIDWSLPCPSIFLTRAEARAVKLQVVRPLADKTLARIARGFKRYVLDRPDPFIVRTDMTSAYLRNGVHSVDEPLNTVTTAGPFAVVTPFITKFRNGATGQPIDEPVPTVTANSFIKRPGGASPLGVVTPFLSHAQQGGRSRPADAPAHTITASTKDQNQVVTGFLVPRYGERPGQEPRSHSVEDPAPVVVPTGNGGSLAACYLAQHNGGDRGAIGRPADEPVATVATAGAQIQPVMGYLATLRRNTRSIGPDEPLGTVSTSGAHQAAIMPFVTSYYSSGGQDSAADAPMPTVPTKARFSPITAEIALPPLSPEMAERARMVAAFLRAHGAWDGPGEFVTMGEFIVWDIGMRMLTPRELARAQGFPDDYDITAGGRLTETAQRHKIGNSVSPPAAEAVARANCVEALTLPDVKRRQRAAVPTWPGFPIEAPRQSTFLEAAE
ncbi:DNA cytosine methyltransferase [Bosea sp. 2YAB26]|uniref:DNA cytosine methyltransferase n=1 Tax=Bosea sp. 2YAB26 TaxID=3237478 RepID=UPI003F927B92